MAIFCECDECGKKYRMPDNRAGQTVPCKQCGAEVDVPGEIRLSGGGGGPSRGGRGGSAHQLPTRSAGSERPLPRRRAVEEVDEEGEGGFNPVVVYGSLAGGVAFLFIVVLAWLAFRPTPSPTPTPTVAQNNPGNTDPSTNDLDRPGGQDVPSGGLTRPSVRPNRRPISPGTESPDVNPGNAENGAKPDGFKPVENEDDQQPDKPDPLKPIQPARRANEWKVAVDPPETAVEWEPRTIKIRGPRDTRSQDVVFPDAPSLYAAVGSNRSDRYEREIWNVQSKQKVGTVTNTRLFGTMALSADGRYFAGKQSGTEGLLVWDVRDDKMFGALQPFEATTTSLQILAFPGNNRVAAAARSEPLKVWMLPDGVLEREIELPDSYDAKTVSFTPGGRFLAVADTREKVIRAYDLNTGESAGELSPPGDVRPVAASFSPDGEEFAAICDGSGRSRFLVWNVADGKLIVDHHTEGYLKSTIKNAYSYNGPTIDWFPDKQYWLLFGHGVFGRKSGQVLTNIGGDDHRTPRRVIDNDRALVFIDDGAPTLTTYKFDRSQLEKTAETIQSGGTAADANLPPLTNADHDGVRTINLADAGGAWRVEADPAPSPPGQLLPNAVQLRPSSGVMNGLYMSRADGARAVVMHSQVARGNSGSRPASGSSRPKNAATPVWLDVYDLTEGKRLHSLDVSFPTELIAVSPLGDRAVMRIGETQDRLDVYDVNEGAHIVGWRPFKDEPEEPGQRFFSRSGKGSGVKVTAAAFVDGDHVLTYDDKKRITLWKLPECRAVYMINDASQPGLSPNGRYLVVSTGKHFRFFDALSGEGVGDLQSAGSLNAAAFHPDGQRFAVAFTDALGFTLIVWNLADGRIEADFPLPKTGKFMQWCGDNYLLLDGESLIDVGAQMIVWKYNLPKGVHSPVSPDLRHWILAPKTPRSTAIYLAAEKIPDSSATAELSTRKSLSPEFILKPGDRVSLKVQLPPLPGASKFPDDVRRNLRSRFEKNGITVTDGAPLTVHVTLTEGATGKSQNYTTGRSMFGGGGPFGGPRPAAGNTISVSERQVKCRVVMARGQISLWEKDMTFSNTSSFHVRFKDGENLQSKLTENMWNAAKNSLLSFEPPAYVFPPEAVDGLGSSLLTP